MSDDYDDDEPGGLWDPDAFTPPPAPARPALHLVTTPATADRLDQRVAASHAPDDADQQTLVRLEQFRTASAANVPPRRSHATRPILSRAVAAAMLASVVAAVLVAYVTPNSPQHTDRPTSTPRAAAVLAVDTEHAAATREVASADSRVRKASQLTSRTTHHTVSKSPSVPAAQNRAAPRAHHAPTVSGSHPGTSVTTTVARTAAPAPRHQAQAASATSEFGFEG
jgi:hypothetical protein